LVKPLHTAGSLLLLSNIRLTAVQRVVADPTRNASVIALSKRLVTIAEHVFTASGFYLFG